MISSRWAPAVLALLLIALVPTVIHTYVDWRIDDGSSVSAIDHRLADFVGRPVEGDNPWLRETFDATEWIYRTYRSADGAELQLIVAKSYDVKRLYHHPEKGIPYGRFMDPAGVESLAADKEIPVHLLASEGGATGAGYVLVYKHSFVADPVRLQLRLARAALFEPRQPMTLFFVFDPRTEATGVPFAASRKGRLLAAAIHSYLSPE